jgi:hypothetical protein
VRDLLRKSGLTACLAFAVLLTGVSAPPASTAAPRALQAPGLVLTYRAAPEARLALRAALQQRELARFETWKKSGLLADYKLLFSRYVNTDGWDAMAVLTFSSEAALAKWRSVEDATPSGLLPESIKLTTEIHTTPVDEVRENRAEQRRPAGVYLVIPYVYLVSHDEYVHYLDQYVLPQFDGWIGEHAVSEYQIFLGRYPAGRPWGSLILVEYQDDAALGRRDAVTAKVRRRLSDDPQWKAVSDAKKSVRVENALTVADELVLR